MTLEELSQIDVTTPSKEPVKAFQTAAAIFVITGEDIKRSGATSIPEALRLAPGVEVARIDSNKWSIGIRGFGSRLSRSVLVLIDGRTVYTTLFDGTYWEVQDTFMDDIDRIELIRGPGGFDLGTERGQRRHQRDHKELQRHEGNARQCGRRKLRAGFRRLPLWRR